MGVIQCYKDKVRRLGYNPRFRYYPSLYEIKSFDFSSKSRMIREGDIVILENDYNKFAAIKVTKVFRNNFDIDHLLEFDYKIYTELT